MTEDKLDTSVSAWNATNEFSASGDSSLANGLVRGRRDALAAVYERHSGLVHDVAQGLCGEQVARRVVQQTFLDLWRKPSEFDPAVQKLRSYLINKAHLLATEERRIGRVRSRARPIRQWEIGGGDDPGTSSASHAWPLLSRLPADERDAIWMTYFVGYTAGELALRQGRLESMIRHRIITGLRRLRSMRSDEAPPAGD